jgi:hypothetical protein
MHEKTTFRHLCVLPGQKSVLRKKTILQRRVHRFAEKSFYVAAERSEDSLEGLYSAVQRPSRFEIHSCSGRRAKITANPHVAAVQDSEEVKAESARSAPSATGAASCVSGGAASAARGAGAEAARSAGASGPNVFGRPSVAAALLSPASGRGELFTCRRRHRRSAHVICQDDLRSSPLWHE